MKSIAKRAKSMAQWILRRVPILKPYNLPKMFEDMLNEQKEIDEHEHNNSLNALYEMHQKQLAKYDADLKETKRQRDEYYDELTKLRIEKIELANKAVKAHCSFCEAHNACVDRGGFYCPETESILKAIGI